ncbi:trypco2 family protein [Gordonia rhizosphera]|uniref:Trypsin-co-occurring domain-containing protein n=1 Tax=Gordonia rhizosphera NBRC 16068 TaxID=1108045 RepID=K6WMT7_9ACTN|nr:trypco2 family protein [Gordonia rhizosphera]GAB93447.1 hypothetical protein GORHZ_222_00020 [Gordonia rhizosphera NBRC 16068]
MSEPVGEQRPHGAAALSDAIASLRNELVRSMWLSDTTYTVNGTDYRLAFKPAPIELTLEVALTVTGKGEAGVKWWVVNATAGGSVEHASTQTITLTLDPKLTNRATGEAVEVLIEGADTSGDPDSQLKS